jgi:hypothetical protein
VPNGTTATTQSTGDSTTKVATDQEIEADIAAAGAAAITPFNGFVTWCAPTNSTVIGCIGGSATISAGTSAGGTAAGATAPYLIESVSAATSGDSAGWYGLPTLIPVRAPLATFGVAFTTSTDYSANSRIWLGINNGCAQATLIASDTPVCNFAMIRWSTVAGDTAYQCVTGNGSTTTANPIGTTAPAAAFVVMSVVENGTTSATCKVGSTSVTNTTTLPTGAGSVWLLNTYPGGGVTHLYSSGWSVTDLSW